MSGLSEWVGTQLASLDAIPSYAIVIIVCVMITTFIEVTSRGGALGYFLGGYVPPGTPNWHPILEKISPKIDTPF